MQELAAEIRQLGQTVLLLQGGGALGAYQAGVYQALHEAGIEPDWVIGVSIGAGNAARSAANNEVRARGLPFVTSSLLSQEAPP